MNEQLTAIALAATAKEVQRLQNIIINKNGLIDELVRSSKELDKTMTGIDILVNKLQHRDFTVKEFIKQYNKLVVF